MASRYSKYKIINNANPAYEFLRKERGLKNIVQYETPYMHNPTVGERASLKSTTHLWQYGDRFYKLADKFYQDTRYWWVIAFYNGYITEADVRPGDALSIPLNLENVLEVMRAY
jgi:nucleoid-associated protein YgaU